MRTTEELLIAYADGELAGEDLKRAEALLKSRDDLKAFVERQRALRRELGAAFTEMLDEPVPDRLLATLANAPVSWRWRMARKFANLTHGSPSRRLAIWTGLPAAAGLACGIFLALTLVPQGAFRLDNGAMIVHGELSTALDRRLASDMSGNIRIGLSFKSKDGRYCRTFEKGGTASSLAGVACRDASGWSVAALAATSPEGSAYRMAGAMPDPVRSAVEGLISGQPLNASQERRARNQGWQGN